MYLRRREIIDFCLAEGSGVDIVYILYLKIESELKQNDNETILTGTYIDCLSRTLDIIYLKQ